MKDLGCNLGVRPKWYLGEGHTRGGRPGNGPGTGLWALTGTAPGVPKRSGNRVVRPGRTLSPAGNWTSSPVFGAFSPVLKGNVSPETALLDR